MRHSLSFVIILWIVLVATLAGGQPPPPEPAAPMMLVLRGGSVIEVRSLETRPGQVLYTEMGGSLMMAPAQLVDIEATTALCDALAELESVCSAWEASARARPAGVTASLAAALGRPQLPRYHELTPALQRQYRILAERGHRDCYQQRAPAVTPTPESPASAARPVPTQVPTATWAQIEAAQAEHRRAQEQAAQAPPAPAAAADLLELSSLRARRQTRQYILVSGQVRNLGSQSLENVTVVVVLYTTTGEMISSSHALIEFNPVLPDQVSPWQVYLDYNPAANRVKVHCKELLGGTISTRGRADAWLR